MEPEVQAVAHRVSVGQKDRLVRRAGDVNPLICRDAKAEIRGLTSPARQRNVSISFASVADLDFPWLCSAFLKTSRFACSFTKIEQLGTTNASVTLDFDVSNLW